MISIGELMGFVPTTDTARARAFYEGVLGLRFVSEDPFALVVQSNGTLIRVTKVGSFTPAAFTILGWRVEDIDREVDMLGAKGVIFQRYPPLEQSANGIWTAPGGSRIAWFQDPDANILSLSHHPDEQ